MNGGKPWVVKLNASTPLPVLSKRVTVLADQEASGGIELFFVAGAEGSGEKPHAHAWDEAMFVIDGQLELLVPGEPAVSLGAGELSYCPGGATHGFSVKSARATWLQVSSQGGAARFYAEMAHELGDTLSLPKLMELLQRHAITAAPPPTP
jgi:quercetin dioxygenase-like cupin family protein